jgi:hypothetical protein
MTTVPGGVTAAPPPLRTTATAQRATISPGSRSFCISVSDLPPADRMVIASGREEVEPQGYD